MFEQVVGQVCLYFSDILVPFLYLGNRLKGLHDLFALRFRERLFSLPSSPRSNTFAVTHKIETDEVDQKTL